jgi:hypothetical protein
MPINPRCTFFFRDGLFSWTETYYYVAAAPDLKTVLPAAIALGKQRTALIATNGPDVDGNAPSTAGPDLEEIRVSFDDTWRDSLITFDCARGGPQGTYPAAGQNWLSNAEAPFAVYLLRCEGGPLYRRSLYLSGVPSGIFGDPNKPDPTNNPTWNKAFQGFVRLLTGGLWGFKVRVRDQGLGIEKPVVNVQGVALPPDQETVTVTVNGHGYSVFDAANNRNRVVIRNTKYSTKGRFANGTNYIQTVVDANNFTITVPQSQFPVGHYTGGGFCRLLVYALEPFTNVQVVAETHRKRGGRSLLPLGRSRNRAV